MITVIKKIIVKEKEGKRQGKKTQIRRDSNLESLFQRDRFTTGPRGLSRLYSAKSFDLYETVNTSKEV